jgi:tetratricopeptide (TPR) repeat protein
MAGIVGAAALVAAGHAGVALARNPHCSGGILYVTQGMRDKDKGDMESYHRQMNKAVSELEQCANEDPKDSEALGYLGWAYAEVDSACLAGKAFDAAIKGLTEKGDKKKVEWATGNRNSYWARAFNEGIQGIQTAQMAYPEFSKPPTEDEKALKEEARKNYEKAIVSLTHATCLKPGDPQTMRNLGSVYAFMGEFDKAQAAFQEGLKAAPGDSSLQYALKAVRTNYARGLVDAKKYDEAIAYFTDLVKNEAGNADAWTSLADALFRRAQSKEGDARKADFRAAADAYAKAFELKSSDTDLAFNAALAYQNTGAWDKAEALWRQAAKARPDDVEILASLGAVLAEQKKYDEAIRTLHQAVNLQPKNKNLHRQFGNIYTKAGNNVRATEELMVYLAMQNGQPAADAAAAAKAAREGSAAAKTLATEGTPEQVIPWEADQDKYETWLYYAKKRAYTFKAGSLVTKSDWTAADTSVPSSAKK